MKKLFDVATECFCLYALLTSLLIFLTIVKVFRIYCLISVFACVVLMCCCEVPLLERFVPDKIVHVVVPICDRHCCIFVSFR